MFGPKSIARKGRPIRVGEARALFPAVLVVSGEIVDFNKKSEGAAESRKTRPPTKIKSKRVVP